MVFDTETTGLYYGAQVVEIAIVDHQGKPLLDSLVRPTAPIPASASAIHGITDNDVAGAPTLVDLWPTIASAWRTGTLFAYNLPYDLRVLDRSFRLLGSPHDFEYIGTMYCRCIMKLYTDFYGDWSERHQSNTSQSLGAAAAQCGIQVQVQAHRALSDAQTALAVLEYMARTG